MTVDVDADLKHWLEDEANLSPAVVEPRVCDRDVLGPDTAARQNELKLLSEEYRACSARADELARLIWQTFLGVLALSGAAGGAVTRELAGEPAAVKTLLLIASCLLVVYLLAKWKAISSKWNLQQRALYQRLNHLERSLGFRTNVQFRRVDMSGELERDSRGGRKPLPTSIGVLREDMAFGLVIWWALLGGLSFGHMLALATECIPQLSKLPGIQLATFIAGLAGFGILVGWYREAPGRKPVGE